MSGGAWLVRDFVGRTDATNSVPFQHDLATNWIFLVLYAFAFKLGFHYPSFGEVRAEVFFE